MAKLFTDTEEDFFERQEDSNAEVMQMSLLQTENIMLNEQLTEKTNTAFAFEERCRKLSERLRRLEKSLLETQDEAEALRTLVLTQAEIIDRSATASPPIAKPCQAKRKNKKRRLFDDENLVAAEMLVNFRGIDP